MQKYKNLSFKMLKSKKNGKLCLNTLGLNLFKIKKATKAAF